MEEDDLEAGKDRLFVTALARGLTVLRAFQPGDSLLGNQELAARTGLPKSTISRLTYTLLQLGYLAQDPDSGRYRPGVGVLALGYAALSTLDLRDVAAPLMRALSQETGHSVTLAARSGVSMIYVEASRAPTRLGIKLDVGSTVPLATTAIGRAWLAGLSAHERSAVLDELRLHYASRWPAIHAGITTALQDYAEKGYCLSLGEFEADINAIGVALQPRPGQPPLALNCSGPAFRLSKAMLEEEIAPRLLALARQLGGAA